MSQPVLTMTVETDETGQVIVSSMERYRCYGSGESLEAACADFIASLRDVYAAYVEAPADTLTADGEVFRDELQHLSHILALLPREPGERLEVDSEQEPVRPGGQ